MKLLIIICNFFRFLKAYESHGVNFWGITVENEPGQGLLDRNPLNCLGLTPESERDFTKLNLGPTLAKAGYGSDKLKIMIHDDNIGGVEGRVNKILSDKEAAKYVSGIGIHWYGNLYGIAPKTLDKVHNKFPNYFILNTESSIMATRKNGLLSFGNWTDGERYAYDIIMVFTFHFPFQFFVFFFCSFQF